ncbi:MAG: hypothetical protein IPP98_06020 [Gemmatimonadetes bacterium]|nr:hypothetical protein [Gemmatimonadota bacterium]MBL0178672.1 hypothetical protein [Gemmatimonadota bacterium]
MKLGIRCAMYGAVLLGASGCADAAEDRGVESVPLAVLDLERMPFAPDSVVAPFGQVSVVADAEGGLYFLGQTIERFWITHLDSTGRLIRRFGREGSGPGELSGGGVLLGLGADSLVVVDTRRSVAVIYDGAGNFLGETRLPPSMFPLAAADQAVFGFDPMEILRGGSPRVVRLSLGTPAGEVREVVLDSTSPTFIAPYRRTRAGGSPPPIPAFSASGGWRAVADGVSGRIAVVGPDTAFDFTVPFEPFHRGPKELSQIRASLTAAMQPTRGPGGKIEPVDPALAARLDTLAREHLPYTAWPGLVIDARGRVTLIAGRNDSTAVDVFQGSQPLAHAMLDCYRPGKRISLRGRWLALQCTVGDESDPSFELRLYRLRS